MVALVALLVGLVNTGYSVVQWSRSADLRFLAPDQVTIVPKTYPDGRSLVRIAARFSYVNMGPRGKADIILREELRFRTSGGEYVQHWQSFELFRDAGCEFASDQSLDVEPVVVDGTDAKSHVSFFAPRSRSGASDPLVDFLTLEDLVAQIQAQPALSFSFEAFALGGKALANECRAALSEAQLQHLSAGCVVTLACKDPAERRE